MRLRIALISTVFALAACGNDGPSIVDSNNGENNQNGDNSSANSSTDNSASNNGETFPGYVDGVSCVSDGDCAGTCGADSVCEGGGGDGVLPDGEACTDDADCAGTCGSDNSCAGDPRSTNNTTNNNNATFPGYVDGTDCIDDGDCAGTCGAGDTCEGGGGDGVLPDGESCTDDAECAGTCGSGDTCEGDTHTNGGTNNGTTGTNNGTAGTNNGTTGGTNNDTFPGYVDGADCTDSEDCAGTCGPDGSCRDGGGEGVHPDGDPCTDDADCAGTCGADNLCEGDPNGGNGGNNVSDAAEGETGGLCPLECSSPVNDTVISCDGCAEGRCDFVDSFNAYCTRSCDGPADCADLGTSWDCVDGSCDL